MKSLSLYTAIFLSAIILQSCSKDDDGEVIIPTMSAEVDGKRIDFNDVSIIEQTMNGAPYLQQIKGWYIKEDSVKYALQISYLGYLVVDNSTSSYSFIGAAYYENELRDQWGCDCAFNLELSITNVAHNRVTGFLADFDAIAKDSTIKKIRNIEFKNVLIEKIQHTTSNGPVI